MNKDERIAYLKCEVYRLQNIQITLKDIQRGGDREVWCCSVDHLPHTGGFCPSHPDAERETVREAIKALDNEIYDLTFELLDLET